MKKLYDFLERFIAEGRYLFTLHDLHGLFPELSYTAFKTLLSRVVTAGLLKRLCRGLYFYEKAMPHDGLLLFHAAATLRAHEYNYLSLETVLSDASVISQIPLNWVTFMSSGRSNLIRCGDYGTIEFIHTSVRPEEVAGNLNYDAERGVWRANISQAIKDMRKTHRNCDLVDWELVDELV